MSKPRVSILNIAEHGYWFCDHCHRTIITTMEPDLFSVRTCPHCHSDQLHFEPPVFAPEPAATASHSF